VVGTCGHIFVHPECGCSGEEGLLSEELFRVLSTRCRICSDPNTNRILFVILKSELQKRLIQKRIQTEKISKEELWKFGKNLVWTDSPSDS